MKMQISVVIAEVRNSKGVHYGNFIFPGGTFSIRITESQFNDLIRIEGQQINASFAMRASQIVRFNRAFTVFEVGTLLNWKEEEEEEEHERGKAYAE